MGNSPGAQQNPQYCMLAGALNVSLDGGATWAAVVSVGNLPVATPTANGLMSAERFTALQNVGEYHLDIDMTTTGDKGVIVPAQTGRTFIAQRCSEIVLAVTGTASGTAPQISMGVSSAFTNLQAALTLLSVAQINAGAGTVQPSNISGATTTPLVSNSDIHLAVTTAVTGATVLSVRVSVLGYWTNF